MREATVTILAAVLGLGVAGGAVGATDPDYPIRFACGEGDQRFSILVAADANARLIVHGRPGEPECALHLEEVEGDPGSREPGNLVQFDFLRKACNDPGLQLQVAREVFVHYYDFWSPDARPLAMYRLGSYPVKCEVPVIDWGVVESLDHPAK